jgi:anti-sigma B factor antagonist
MTGATESSFGSCWVTWEEAEHGRLYVTVAGEVDLHTAPQLERALSQPARELVVDLVDCEFIDSTGLAVLIEARGRVDRLTLIAPGVEVRRILEISGLDQIIPVHGSRGSLNGTAADA